MADVIMKAIFVIFLNLIYVNLVFALITYSSYIMNFIFPFFFVIWRRWNLKFMFIFCFIYLQKSIFGKTMLKPNSIQSNASYLDSNRAFRRSSWIQLLKILIKNLKLFSILTNKSLFCYLIWSKFRYFKRP